MDTFFAAIVAAFSVSGCFKGLVKSGFSFLGFVIALVLSIFCAKVLVPILQERGFLRSQLESVANFSLGRIDEELLTRQFSSQFEMAGFVKSLNANELSKEWLREIIEEHKFEGSCSVKQIVFPRLEREVLSVGIFVLLLIAFYFLAKLVLNFLTKTIRLHFFVFTNRVAGFIFGAVLGGLVCFVATSLAFALSRGLLFSELTEKLLQSQLASNIYQNYAFKFVSLFV